MKTGIYNVNMLSVVSEYIVNAFNPASLLELHSAPLNYICLGGIGTILKGKAPNLGLAHPSKILHILLLLFY